MAIEKGRRLNAAGYQVRTADSGEKALAAFAVEPPQVLITDLRMGGMDGMMWCRMVCTVITMLTLLGLAITALLSVYLTPTKFVSTEVTETVAIQPQ